MNEEQDLEELCSEGEPAYETEPEGPELPEDDAQETSERDTRKKKNDDKKTNWRDEVVWYAKVFLVAAVLAIVVRVLTPIIFVDGESMNNTLYDNELCIGCTFIEVHRGDIIIFKNEDTYNSIYIKRIIGEPGDTVVIQGDEVYINGELLAEPYAYYSDSGEHYPYQDVSVVLGEGEYFVCGDNRYNSRDSRVFGAINKEDIQAKIIFRLDMRWLTNLWGD